MEKFDALIKSMAKAGMSPREILESLKGMGTPVTLDHVMKTLGIEPATPPEKAKKPSRPKTPTPPEGKPAETPKRLSASEISQMGPGEKSEPPPPPPQPRLRTLGDEEEPRSIEVPEEVSAKLARTAAKVKRAGKVVGKHVAEHYGFKHPKRALAHHLEKKYGKVGRHYGRKIRARRGERTLGQVLRGRNLGGVGGQAAISAVDAATKSVVAGLETLGKAVQGALSKIEYGVRSSTKSIVDELQKMAVTLRREESREEESRLEERDKNIGEVVAGEQGETPSRGLSAVGAGAAGLVGGAVGATMLGGGKRDEKRGETPREMDFVADTIIFRATDSIVFKSPSLLGASGAGGGFVEGSGVGPFQRGYPGTVPGPGGKPVADDRLLQPTPMSSGPAPDETRPGSFTPTDLGNFKSVQTKRTGVEGVGTGSSLRDERGRVVSTADTSLSVQDRTLLDTIASRESPDYNTIVGGSKFSSFADHPNVKVNGSTAAGRYQFIASTWRDVVSEYNKKHPDDPIRDFSPKNQDRAALFLAQRDYRRRTGRDLETDLREHPDKAGEILQMGLGGRGMNTTWQSFQLESARAIQKTYRQNYAKNEQLTAPPPKMIEKQRLEEDVAPGEQKFEQVSSPAPAPVELSPPPPLAGSQINRMSTDAEVKSTKTTAGTTDERGAGQQKRSGIKRKNEFEDPPATSFDDHFRKFPGLADDVPHPGIGA